MQLNNITNFKSSEKAQQNRALEDIKSNVTKEFSGEKISRIHVGTSIQGNLIGSDSLYFSGDMVGEIRNDNKIVLGETADFKGNIYALNLIILGKVEGNIYIQEKVILGDKSVFRGKISAKTIEVKNGAIFNAECIVKPYDQNQGELATQLQRETAYKWDEKITW